jgi:hypothetical protein
MRLGAAVVGRAVGALEFDGCAVGEGLGARTVGVIVGEVEGEKVVGVADGMAARVVGRAVGSELGVLVGRCEMRIRNGALYVGTADGTGRLQNSQSHVQEQTGAFPAGAYSIRSAVIPDVVTSCDACPAASFRSMARELSTLNMLDTVLSLFIL